MLENFNILLFLQFVIYIICLLIGFKIQSTQKKQLNQKYKTYKTYLTFLIITIFTISASVLAFTTLNFYMMGVIFSLHMMFSIYLLWGIHFNTRCWKQHRMVYYNFFLIFIMNVSMQLVGVVELLTQLVFVLICVYTILEFQFAKFSLKQTLMWD
ncbi:MAG: hypothetical protein LAT82_05065 [Nanoarchaeota archaeon]|nr:hypothetical protein [Nanoarchaeota archaeon]